MSFEAKRAKLDSFDKGVTPISISGDLEEKSLSHYFFEHVAFLCKQSTLELYTKYLSFCIGTECSTGLSGLINEQVIQTFFNYKRAPAHFNFKTYYDVTLLSNVIEKPIVILHSKSLENYYRNVGVKKIFDNRLLFSNLGENEEAFKSSISYLVCKDGTLYFFPTPFNYNVITTESGFVKTGTKIVKGETCLLKGLINILIQSAGDNDNPLLHHRCNDASSDNCEYDLLNICLNNRRYVSQILNLQQDVCLVNHIRTDVYSTPNKQLFVTLGVLKSVAGHFIDWKKTKFVAVSTDVSWIYSLNDKHASSLLPSLGNALAEHKSKSDAAVKENNTEQGNRVLEKNVKEQRNGSSNNDTTVLKQQRRKCPCRFCIKSEQYGEKQLKKGPQRLNTQSLTLFDYLVHFNLNTAENRNLILQCCKLSVASLDFECLSQESVNNPLSRVPRDVISDLKLGSSNVPLVTQRPVLFAHADNYSTTDHKQKDTTTTTSSTPTIIGSGDPNAWNPDNIINESNNNNNNNTTAAKKYCKYYHVPEPDQFVTVLEAYIKDLLKRQEILKQQKLNLLGKLIDFVNVFKDNHKKFYFKRGVKPKTIELSWKANLFGKFETELYKLCSVLKVYSFNGAHYDHIILARYIVMACSNIVDFKPTVRVPPFYTEKEILYLHSKGSGRENLTSPTERERFVINDDEDDDDDDDIDNDDDDEIELQLLEDYEEKQQQQHELFNNNKTDDDEQTDKKRKQTMKEVQNMPGKSGGGRPIRVRLNKEGSCVNQISLVNCHIGFFDLKKFLPPNASLASLAEMTGCRESKGMFPFELLTSYDWLVKQVELPEDQELWRSRLNDKTPSVEAIQECIEEFKKDGHPNLLSYLMKYLQLDVQLLLECTIKLFESFYELVGSHPIVSGKNSISSFSFASLQTYLMRQKSVGSFIPNHPKIFSILKGSLLGGVSLVCRTDGGSASKTPINAHLGHTNMPKKVLYYDINSLYGISGK